MSQQHEAHLHYNIDGIEIVLVTFFITYDSKAEVAETLSDGTPEQLEVSKQVMLFDQSSDVNPVAVEVGWRYLSDTHSTELTPVQRKQLMMEFIPDLREILRLGYNDYKPQEGMFLFAYPHGMKNYFDMSDESAKEGSRQRALFARRVGFGKLKEDDLVWGIYDANGRVLPL